LEHFCQVIVLLVVGLFFFSKVKTKFILKSNKLGMKKIQEFISYEENLTDLLNNDENLITLIRAVFAEFFKLDNNVK
jgi:hypothetical protein